MSPVNTSSASTTHVRVGSDHVPTSARSSGTTSPAPVASASAYVATAHSSSDSHCNRDLFAIAMTLSNVPTPDVPLMEIIYDLFCTRGAEAFVALIGSPMPVSRAALHHILVNDFGGRALAIGVKWREEDPLQITGIVTCGPVSLGSHWRLSAVFAATHRVPLTLNVMQLATRLWFATLGRQWPRNLTWRAARGSVEGRRILETLLVFHAKKPGQRRPELWASITASGEEYDLAPVEVRLGAGPFGAELLEDLATWGVGGARWAAEEAPALLASVSALPADWSGYVFYGAELPMSCRGFQHMTPLDRETLLGQPIAEMLNSIAVTQRAAMARLRNLESKNFASGASAAPTTAAAAAAADATSDAAWKSLVAVQAVSPPAKPAPTPRLSSTDECEDDASWRSLFSTKSVTPALSPRFHHHDVSVLRH